MPQENGTGPVGAGPMTGRGAGKCAGNETADGQTAKSGRGMQRGNRGGGHPHGYFRTHSQHAVASAKAMLLQEKIDKLNVQLASLQKQLADLVGEQND